MCSLNLSESAVFVVYWNTPSEWPFVNDWTYCFNRNKSQVKKPLPNVRNWMGTCRRPPSPLPGQEAAPWWRPAGWGAEPSAGAGSNARTVSTEPASRTWLREPGEGTALNCVLKQTHSKELHGAVHKHSWMQETEVDRTKPPYRLITSNTNKN